MKITVNASDLASVATACNRVVAARSTLPVLSTVLIEADSNEVRLSTTDLETWEVGTVPAEVTKGGAICVPAKRFMDAISRLGKDDVTLKVTKQKLTISAGDAEYELQGLSKEEFPARPTPKVTAKLVIPPDLIAKAVQACIQCVSEDETRVVLTNVLLEVKEGGSLSFTATDGRRLSQIQGTSTTSEGTAQTVLLSVQALTEASRIASETKGDVTLEISDNMIAFSGGNKKVISKQTEGSYPNYRQVLPEGECSVATVDREEFLVALNRAAVLDTKESPSISLAFELNELTVGKKLADVGSFRERVDCDAPKPFSISLSRRYLEEALKSFPSDRAEVRSFGPAAPIIVGPAGGDEARYNLIMPIRES